MKKLLIAIVLLGIGVVTGYLLSGYIRTGHEMASASPVETEPDVLYWVAPMDPNYRRDKPGKSPMGMDLVPVYADEGTGSGVSIDPALVNSLGVRTQPATVRPLWRKVEATGYVSFDENLISHINLRTQGWIVRLLVNAEGEKVSKGDLLFELYSPELVNAQKEFLQILQREDPRLASGAEEKLRALGMIPSGIAALRESGVASENIKVVAPRDGVVTQLNVREGMYVQPNATALSLAGLDSVWLQAEIFESQADWVAEGQAAEARLDYAPGSVFAGEVEYVYPVLDPKTRTLRVRLKFDNPGQRLKPNMYARVAIFGRLRPKALSIPQEALIRGPERDRVVVSAGGGKFRVHEVLAGMESGRWVEIVAGIDEGDDIVTSAQFLIDSEASLAGSIVRLGEIPTDSNDRELAAAFGAGWIEEINAADHRMRISHGPIDELGWPAMNMDFEVARAVDLTAFVVGQDIRFQLRQTESGRFVVTAAFRRDADDEDVLPRQVEQLIKADARADLPSSAEPAQQEHDHD